MLKTIALVVISLIAVLLIYATTRPDTFSVQRQIRVKAPPDKIFPLLTDFHSWSEWSPWEKLDPAMKRTFSGAANGKGAVYAWDSAGKAGTGRMEILEAPPPGPSSSKVVIQLDFMKPFEAHNTAEFTLQPHGDTTEIIWVMHGPALFISKVMGIFFNMDKMIGADFETGLANLKGIAEK